MTNDSGDVANERLQTAGLLTRVVRGTAVSLFAGGAVAITSFIVTPFTIRLFGPEQYGIWATLTAVVSYLRFADLGMSTASTRFASDAYARGDSESESAVIWTSTAVALIASAIFAGVLWFFAEAIAKQLIHASPELHRQSVLAVRISGVIFIGYVLSGIWNTAELVRLRMGLFNGINTIGSVLQIALVPVVLMMGWGLPGVVSVVACVSICVGMAHCFVSGRLVPGFWSVRIQTRLIRPLLNFGAPLVFSFFAEMALLASDKLVLAQADGPRAVAHYTVAASFAALLAVVPYALSSAMLPAFARLLVFHEKNSLNTFYARAIRGNILWLAPSLIACWIICRPFLSWWAGAEYGEASSVPAYVLLVGWAVDALSFLPARLLVAAGKSRTVALIYAVQTIPFLVCAVFMAQQYGAVGVAWAWTLRAITNGALLFAKARPIAPMGRSPFSGRHLALFASLLPLALVFALAVNSDAGLLVRFFGIAAAICCYVGVAWIRVLTDEERRWFRIVVSGGLASELR